MTLRSLILRELSEGQTEAQLGEAIGISKEVLDGILAGRSPESVETWKQLAAFFRMDMDLLRFGTLRPASCPCDLLSDDPVTAVGEFRKVPLLAWEQVARFRGPEFDLRPEQAPAMIETDASGTRVFALRVRDDAMEPLFHQGEIVFVNPDLCGEPEQYVIAVSREGEGEQVVLRQIRKLDDRLFLHTLNGDYPDRPLTNHDTVVGRVVRLRLNL